MHFGLIVVILAVGLHQPLLHPLGSSLTNVTHYREDSPSILPGASGITDVFERAAHRYGHTPRAGLVLDSSATLSHTLLRK